MMAGEYAEPWEVNEDFAIVDSDFYPLEFGTPAIDSRIIACVNAMDGIADPAALLDAVRDYCEVHDRTERVDENDLSTSQNERAALSRIRALVKGGG